MGKQGESFLTCARLQDAIKHLSEPCSFRTGQDDIWLFGDAIECAEIKHRGRIDRHVMVDTELHEVVVEAFCPYWRVRDVDDALRFSNRWNYEHRNGILLINMWRSRFVWRLALDTVWVMGKEDLERFIENQYIDMLRESSECFDAAYRELHNMRPKDAGAFDENEDGKELNQDNSKEVPPDQFVFTDDPII